MFKKLSLVGAAFAMGAAAMVPATPAAAQSYRDYRGDGFYDRGYRDDRRSYRNDRGYRNNYRYNRNRNFRCENGDGGTVIGAIAGGLLGNQVAGRGDRTVGTIIGAAGGALAGRVIDRSDNRRGCRGL